VLLVVTATYESFHVPVTRVDADECPFGIALVGKGIVNRRLRVLLEPCVECRAHDQSALEHHCGAELTLQFLLHMGHKVRCGVDAVVGVFRPLEDDRLRQRFVVLLLVDEAVREHSRQDFVTAPHGAFQVLPRVQPARLLGEPGEEGGLRESQLVGGLPEVRA